VVGFLLSEPGTAVATAPPERSPSVKAELARQAVGVGETGARGTRARRGAKLPPPPLPMCAPHAETGPVGHGPQDWPIAPQPLNVVVAVCGTSVLVPNCDQGREQEDGLHGGELRSRRRGAAGLGSRQPDSDAGAGRFVATSAHRPVHLT